jgi:hypothetical protein
MAAPSARPLNYTTKIAAAQTVGECQPLLARSGASAVAVEYESGEPVGLSFRLDTPHGRRDFTLPVNIDGMHAVLQKAGNAGMFAAMHVRTGQFTSPEHAANVAWRVIRDWLEANLALIAAGMAGIDQVMLPYLHVAPDRTLYQAYRERETALELTPGGDQ